jgi:hydrophobic/amphiphilic exporter-1 (mainly G- bacteria), HAE1 family
MIANTFIKRPVTAIVISLVLIISGVISMFNLAVDQYPNISPPSVGVSGSYTGADAQTVEQTVAIPIEEQVNGTPGMEYMQSTSTNTGGMSVRVTFNIGTNVYVSALNVQNRVGIAQPLLPAVVSKLGLTVRASNPDQLMLVAVFSPNGTHNITFLDNYTNVFIQDAILRVPGVGDVQARTDQFAMRIWLNPQKMASYNITTSDVSAALNAQNAYVAAGSAGAPPQLSSQSHEYGIVVNGMLSKPADYENIVVKTNPATGELLYLKDFARVELGKFTFSSNAFTDGKRCSLLMIYQTPGSNALQTADLVYAKLAELKKTFPTDVDYKVPFEAITIIRVSMEEVVKTLMQALGLVALVVFLFLQNWRSTIIPIFAIPVSILGTFCFFIPLGFTINTLTMFGFVLAIGIVVDDAIIVVEAVQHYIDEQHMSAKEATYHAMKEISAPVVAIALILAAVFVPVGFIPGIVGRLYQQFAITIAISVILSAFIALSLTPALCTLLLKPHDPQKKKNLLDRFFAWFDRGFNRFIAGYTHGVRRSIRYSWLIIVVLAGICFGAFFLFRAEPSGFVPSEDGGRVFVTFQLADASSTTESVEVMEKIMKVVNTTPGILHYTAVSGFNILNGGATSNSGSFFVMLAPWAQRTTRETQWPGIKNVLDRRIAAAGVKNASVVVIQPAPIRGIGISAGFAFQIEEGSSTDDIYAFEKTVQRFTAEAKKNPSTSTAYCYFSAHTPSYDLTVNREKCQKLGVDISQVFTTMQAFMGSLFLSNFTLYNRTFHVVMQADTTYRALIEDMNKYYVRNTRDSMVPLSTLISYKSSMAPPLVTHFNIFRSAEVDGSIPPGYSSGQSIADLRKLAAKYLPRGYTYDFSGLSYEEIKAGSMTVYIFTFCIIFVFLFLAALYESWSVPLAVMLAVPISAFGAILALWISPTLTNNVYAQIGLITLIGLSAKNAILIVEFAKIRVDQGEDLIMSTLEAVRLRIRPIIMTSLAFILGVMPLVLASGAGDKSRNTIGVTVLGGMIASSTISIFIVPVLYVLLTRWSYGTKELAWLKAHRDELTEKSKKVEAQNIDPELEYEIEQAHNEHNETKERRANGS